MPDVGQVRKVMNMICEVEEAVKRINSIVEEWEKESVLKNGALSKEQVIEHAKEDIEYLLSNPRQSKVEGKEHEIISYNPDTDNIKFSLMEADGTGIITILQMTYHSYTHRQEVVRCETQTYRIEDEDSTDVVEIAKAAALHKLFGMEIPEYYLIFLK